MSKSIAAPTKYSPDNLPAWASEWHDGGFDRIPDEGWPVRRIGADGLVVIEQCPSESEPHILLPAYREEMISSESATNPVIQEARLLAAALLEAADLLDRDWASQAPSATRDLVPRPATEPEVKPPAWTNHVSEWDWESVAGTWQREVSHVWRDDRDMVIVSVYVHQIVTLDGTVTLGTEPEIDIDVSESTDAGTARAAARCANEAADLLDHIQGRIPRRGATPIANDLIARAIRAEHKAKGLQHSQFAVAAGYDPSELSQLLLGRVWLDTADIDRFAAALGIDARSLLAIASSEE